MKSNKVEEMSLSDIAYILFSKKYLILVFSVISGFLGHIYAPDLNDTKRVNFIVNINHPAATVEDLLETKTISLLLGKRRLDKKSIPNLIYSRGVFSYYTNAINPATEVEAFMSESVIEVVEKNITYAKKLKGNLDTQIIFNFKDAQKLLNLPVDKTNSNTVLEHVQIKYGEIQSTTRLNPAIVGFLLGLIISILITATLAFTKASKK